MTATASVTESFERFLELETRSMRRLESLQARVRADIDKLQLEIEASKAILGLCEAM